MAAEASSGSFFRCVYEGSISCTDTGKDRRPYHRNCGCALHNNNNNNNSHPTGSPYLCKNSVSYPIRRACSEGNLVLAAASCYPSSPSSSSLLLSPVFELAAGGGRKNVQLLRSRNEDDDDDDHNF